MALPYDPAPKFSEYAHPERSSHTWFVLQHLLGYRYVRNYDGSWTEWGNSVRVPITRGDSP